MADCFLSSVMASRWITTKSVVHFSFILIETTSVVTIPWIDSGVSLPYANKRLYSFLKVARTWDCFKFSQVALPIKLQEAPESIMTFEIVTPPTQRHVACSFLWGITEYANFCESITSSQAVFPPLTWCSPADFGFTWDCGWESFLHLFLKCPNFPQFKHFLSFALHWELFSRWPCRPQA